MRQRTLILTAAALLCAARPVSAQHDHGASGAHDAPATLMSGMGSLHHEIATSSAEAQKFFDQGLTLVYAFNHHEAARSFEHAAELDPHSPMPWWGVALALGPNYNEIQPENEKPSYEAIQKAKALASSAPEDERAYVDALARRFSSDEKPDYAKLGRDYAAAMRDVSHRFPDDPDAATLYAESLMDLHAWALWTNDGQPAENTPEIVSVLESVLRRWPDHAGANHFYIHALEISPNPERAMASAHRLETLVPSAGHLVHMPAHVYIRTGDYEAAVRSNRQAIAADDKLPTPPGGNVTYMMYRGHNIHFLAMAAMMDGDFATASWAAKELVARTSPGVAEMPMLEAFQPLTEFVMLRFGRWDDVLALPQPDAKLHGLTLFWHYARGCAFAAKGKAAQAEAEGAAMEAVAKQLPPGPAFGMLYNEWSTLHDLAWNTLAARIAAARGDSQGAIEHWRAAVAVQDKMSYDEPADWYYPVRESLGAALLLNGKAAEAEQVFRKDLEQNPRNPRSLFGLWKALDAQEKTLSEPWIQAAFEAAWKGSAGPPRLAEY